jgi:hypothetical protein
MFPDMSELTLKELREVIINMLKNLERKMKVLER